MATKIIELDDYYDFNEHDGAILTDELHEKVLGFCAAYAQGDNSQFVKESELCRLLFLGTFLDKNSSAIREGVTLKILDYEQNPDKHGHDGINLVTGTKIEVKPTMHNRTILKSGNARRGSFKGNFNDLTHELIDKKSDFSVVCSGFTNCRLVYIYEFPITDLLVKMHEKVDTVKQRIKDTDKPARTTFGFTYKDANPDNVTVHYFNKKLASIYLTDEFYKMIDSCIR